MLIVWQNPFMNYFKTFLTQVTFKSKLEVIFHVHIKLILNTSCKQ